jgi:hypothetical protein
MEQTFVETLWIMVCINFRQTETNRTAADIRNVTVRLEGVNIFVEPLLV